MKPEIILASASPRRKELLGQVGYQFSVCPAQGEEIIQGSTPAQIVKNLAAAKAQEVADRLEKLAEYKGKPMILIGADTVVAVDGQIMGKPVDEKDAHRMLNRIAGNSHEVSTGVCLLEITEDGSRKEERFSQTTKVEVYSMSEEEIQTYIASKDPMDKAGAYGIQGAFAAYIKGIEGDYNNVVGLPVGLLCQKLRERGLFPE
ncbi:MAG: Maf family protein [Lachnospiraceae bacterium]